MTILFWHRRDLRVHDNRGLYSAYERDPDVVPLFIVDPGILGRSDTGAGRVQFMLSSLRVLDQQYQHLGSRLIVRHGDPLRLLPALAQEVNATAVVWNQDSEPYARQRDQQMEQILQQMGIPCFSYQDMLLHGADEILSQSQSPYSIYSPFWKNWIQHPKADPYPTPPALTVSALEAGGIPTLEDLGLRCEQNLPEAGEIVALGLLETFCQGEGIQSYDEHRNFPALEGTSRLSPHLRFGTLGIRTLWQATVDVDAECRSEEALRHLQTWRQEIAWREFYKHALFHWPHLETQSFRPMFAQFEWDNDPALFEAWCQGATGYPIVDAAMRQLNQTGWMHNRCRMIVASFLTKDLLIDWRWGEQYFMQQLVDGDLAANNGGWQWSASVGTDAKPLRIFNPSTQAINFDPEAEYIRHYVPELAGLDPEQVLNPLQMTPLLRRACGYPEAIVDHKVRQHRFKARYQACRGT